MRLCNVRIQRYRRNAYEVICDYTDDGVTVCHTFMGAIDFLPQTAIPTRPFVTDYGSYDTFEQAVAAIITSGLRENK